ncbi:DUF6011 domain-containing protein [Streptosporangium sp. NPDC051023]|uniref:DUF6011 domain-containing protein n=1 Tax=Streptosporangium sp. NPDC051023 TaxID=3155410 RepID=UPI00344F5ECA
MTLLGLGDDSVPETPKGTPRTVQCEACHRRLTDPKSIALKHGEKCAKDRGLIAGPRLVRLARVRAGGHVPGQEDLWAEEAG